MAATSPLPTTSPGGGRLRPLRRGRAAASSAAILALLLAVSAWLSLVFSHHHRPLLLSSSSSSIPSPATSSDLAAGDDDPLAPLALRHLVFGIAGSRHLWPRRREYLRLWWRPADLRGYVWLDAPVKGGGFGGPLPPVRVSEDTSRFRYTNPTGHPSGLRIARIASESFRLLSAGGGGGMRWLVLVDDDTILCPENLVAVLAKYDWREMVYVGGPSESHAANTYFSHGMAFGGGGIALSYPLAEAIAGMQDECLERYPKLYGSDDRLHACITELGVPLTREYGFHQWDIRGNAHGLLAAHPISPFISIHHVEVVDPIFPGLDSLESLKLFTKAMKIDPRSFLQRAFCYNRRRKITFAVSLGYVVQVFPNIVLPRELERSELTYTAWNKLGFRHEFDIDTRNSYRSACKKPILFFLKDISKNGNMTISSYKRAKVRDDLKRKVFCFPRFPPLPDVDEIRVLGNPLSENWHLVPRRLCCKRNQITNGTLEIVAGQCDRGISGSAADFL